MWMKPEAYYLGLRGVPAPQLSDAEQADYNEGLQLQELIRSCIISGAAPESDILENAFLPIEELNLPLWAYSPLKKQSILYVYQILELRAWQLTDMRNFGPKSLGEVCVALLGLGFKLRD